MEGENAMPTYCLGKELMRRIRLYDEGKHDGTVDVLLTGCEVSLWLAEQACTPKPSPLNPRALNPKHVLRRQAVAGRAGMHFDRCSLEQSEAMGTRPGIMMLS